MKEDIEKLFKQEIRDKKVVGYSASKRASRKKGFKGGVKFPYDLLTPSEKRKLTKGEKPVSAEKDYYKDIKNIPDFETITQLMEKEHARNILIITRELHQNKDLIRHWGIRNQDYYKLVSVFNLPKKVDIKNNKKKEVDKQVSQKINYNLEEEVIKNIEKDISNTIGSFRLTYSGEFDGKEILDEISGYLELLKEGRKYKVNFAIERA